MPIAHWESLVRVRELGEFALIERLAALVQERIGSTPSVEHGIGDDAALWRPTPGWVSVLTTDTMLEGVHFRRQTMPWRDLGWKALAVNLSDLAAMAAEPRVTLVTLGLTGEEEVTDILALYGGMADLALGHAVQIVGGDTVRAAQVQIGITALGEVVELDGVAQALRRGAARAGDVLAVTGHPGNAAGGLELLLQGLAATCGALTAAHRRPEPRVKEAAWLFGQGVRCATDSSDSLVRETELLCAASGVAAWIDADLLPLSSALRATLPDRATELALFGGEDYELVLAIPAARFPAIATAWSTQFSHPLTAVGGFCARKPNAAQVRVRNYQGPHTEFEHFPGHAS
ncbi:MAG TPA: thiamine-phosphate kinase [Chloroflexota bacterium]|nr:thiamine-phosphate kinase [Chloroflexota bacterium]